MTKVNIFSFLFGGWVGVDEGEETPMAEGTEEVSGTAKPGGNGEATQPCEQSWANFCSKWTHLADFNIP